MQILAPSHRRSDDLLIPEKEPFQLDGDVGSARGSAGDDSSTRCQGTQAALPRRFADILEDDICAGS